MAEFMFLMHGDAVRAIPQADWGPYLSDLRVKGVLQGGSALGGGTTRRQAGAPGALSGHIGGYLKVVAADLEAAEALLPGNPVYEAGGTVEIRELPVTG